MTRFGHCGDWDGHWSTAEWPYLRSVRVLTAAWLEVCLAASQLEVTATIARQLWSVIVG